VSSAQTQKQTIWFAIFLALASVTQAQEKPVVDLSNASLEQLMNIDVTSASKREQKVSSVAAAIHVVTQEDIRRSGATSIPDLLRMVPGVDVAQVSGGQWAVSVRGFNNIRANKLLVLIDGRSIYDPAFSGTYWNAQDVPLSTTSSESRSFADRALPSGAPTQSMELSTSSRKTRVTQKGIRGPGKWFATQGTGPGAIRRGDRP
jgi:iron complex outermembrane receptor protein